MIHHFEKYIIHEDIKAITLQNYAFKKFWSTINKGIVEWRMDVNKRNLQT